MLVCGMIAAAYFHEQTANCVPQQILALQLCHRDHKLAKFWGVCNQPKWDLDRCLREEKSINRFATLPPTAQAPWQVLLPLAHTARLTYPWLQQLCLFVLQPSWLTILFKLARVLYFVQVSDKVVNTPEKIEAVKARQSFSIWQESEFSQG